MPSKNTGHEVLQQPLKRKLRFYIDYNQKCINLFLEAIAKLSPKRRDAARVEAIRGGLRMQAAGAAGCLIAANAAAPGANAATGI